jgi:hypothetical protein
MRSHNKLALFVCAALASGCASDTTAPATHPLSDSDAFLIGTHLTRELSASMAVVGAGGNPAAIASTRATPARVGAAFSRVSSASASSSELTPACPSLNNTNDSDGDGVPDDATATFGLPQCQGIVGNDTVDITGTIHITDPVASPPPSPAAFGFTAALANFTVHLGARDPSASFTETRNGGEALVFAPAGLQQAHHMSVVREDSAGTMIASEDLHASFVPEQGSVLVSGQGLPNGTYIAAGASSWQHGNVSAEMEISTAVPLDYSASCAAGAPTPFRAGELHARAVAPGAQFIVRIVFANCQAPSITLVAHN